MRALIELKEIVIYNALQIRESLQLSGVLSLYGVIGVKIGNMFDLWMIENFNYFAIAMCMAGVDHLLGSIVHYFFIKDWSWKLNGIGLLIKVSMVLVGIFVFDGLTHLAKNQSLIYDYMKMVTSLVVCLYPASGVMKNMSIITKGKFPPVSLINKFNNFNDTLDTKELKEPNKKEE